MQWSKEWSGGIGEKKQPEVVWSYCEGDERRVCEKDIT